MPEACWSEHNALFKPKGVDIRSARKIGDGDRFHSPCHLWSLSPYPVVSLKACYVCRILEESSDKRL